MGHCYRVSEFLSVPSGKPERIYSASPQHPCHLLLVEREMTNTATLLLEVQAAVISVLASLAGEATGEIAKGNIVSKATRTYFVLN